MNYRSIINIFKIPPLSQLRIPLGRWNIHNHKETIIKVKYATEDNCCISRLNYKNTTQIQENNELDDDSKYIYMMGYESSHK